MPYYKTSNRDLPRFFWICIGLALLPISIGVTILLIRSSQLQITSDRGDTITIDTARKIKQVSNDSEYANKVLLAEIEDLKNKVNLIIERDRNTDPVLQSVATELELLQPVVKEVEKNNERLNEVIDSVE